MGCKVRKWLLAIPVALVIFVRAASGPEGEAIEKASAERVQTAAGRSGFVVTDEYGISATRVHLPWDVALKHLCKAIASSAGLTLKQPEHATAFRLQSLDGKQSLVCAIRSVGDHVVAIELQNNQKTREMGCPFREEITKEFPGYNIQ